MIEHKNRQHLTYTLAVNHLADFAVCSSHAASRRAQRLSQANEWKQMLGRRSSRSAEEIAARIPEVDTPYTGPTSWDWRQQGLPSVPAVPPD